MITPQQASGLKPNEVEWLHVTEKLLDQRLLDGYGGVEVRVRVSRAPFERDVIILRNHYTAAGWNSTIYNVTNGHEIVLWPLVAIPHPKFPEDGVETVVTEVTETAWDKIRMDE
jgi:hypothetical protein